MKRTILLTSLALAAGVGLGLAASVFFSEREIPSPSSAVADPNNTNPLPGSRSKESVFSVALEDTFSPVPDRGVARETDGEVITSTAPGDGSHSIASMTAKLLEERTARRKLEKRLEDLRAALDRMDRRLTALARRNAAQNPPQTGAANNAGVNVVSLVEAGFNEPEAQMIAQRWGEQQMDVLYLRDQATREGWANSPRFREAARDLLNGVSSLRAELSEDDYDRFLYATGQPNRIAVTSVLESSPAREYGLQPGDLIVSYDGVPIRSPRDVRDATINGAPGELITMQLLRDGQPIEVALPRGPIGIRMDSVSVAPN
jgi:hypothetical protein